jgi:type I restriction enzyme, S subunit
VEQDPSDEPASELLKRIARKKAKHGKGRDWSKGESPTDGLSFEAPQGWAWTTIDQTALRVTVGHVGPMKDKYVDEGIPFLRSQNVRANAFRPDGLTFISPEFHQKIIKSALAPRDVVVVRSGNVGTACVVPPELPVANCSDLVVIQSPEAVAPEFPLPPLAEQHRIVAKVDALMALCDRLEAALTTADTTRARLLEALLHEALEPGIGW